jgi:hypothetical protein
MFQKLLNDDGKSSMTRAMLFGLGGHRHERQINLNFLNNMKLFQQKLSALKRAYQLFLQCGLEEKVLKSQLEEKKYQQDAVDALKEKILKTEKQVELMNRNLMIELKNLFEEVNIFLPDVLTVFYFNQRRYYRKVFHENHG